MVLLTPFYLMTDRSHPYRSSVDEYVAAVKSVAAARGSLLVDTQAVMDDLLRHMPSERSRTIACIPTSLATAPWPARSARRLRPEFTCTVRGKPC